MPKKRIQWFEDEKFWEKVDPILFSKQRIENAREEVRCVSKLLRLRRGAHVLDLCCGVGRHSIEMAKRGFLVTAVDKTERYLRKARREAKKQKVAIEFVKSDMRDFCRPNSFNAITNMFTSFGYFKQKEDDRRVAMNMYTSLKKGGRLVMELMGKERLARIFQERGWGEVDNRLILEERTMNEDWSMIKNRWIIIDKKGRHEFELIHRIYSAVELGDVLKECGFSITGVYGGLAGEPYGPNAFRLVMVARKERR